MAGPFLARNVEVFVQKEAVWGTSPGALAGTDALKHTSGKAIKKVVARRDRDQDRDYDSPSVLTTQKGREKSEFNLECQVIPSGNGTTPTEPDVDPLLNAHFGYKHKATAHTTTAAGSVGTSINFAVGGVAASGVEVGDIIFIDVSTAFGYEARRITALPGGDVVTVNAGFSTDPAAGRTVKVGTTYRFKSGSEPSSVHVWEFIEGNNFRHIAPGTLVQNVEGEFDFSNDTPAGTLKFSGEGQAEAAQTSTSRPTPTTAGVPLVPDGSYAFLGGTRNCMLKGSFKSNNGMELRENESCTLYPSGVKRTGNNSRNQVEGSVSMLLTTGTVEGYYDNQSSLTAYDLILQFGKTAGAMVAVAMPKFIPDVPAAEQDGEVSLDLSGRAYGTSGHDELYIAFA